MPNKIKFLLILLTNIALFVFAITLLPIRFEENDDVMMCLIASGAYSGTPDAHLVFINYLYGLLLVGLYGLIPSVEWYSVLFYIIHLFSISIIIYSILIDNTKSLVVRLLFILLFYLVEIRILLLLQFTTTAAIVTFSGVLLITENKLRTQIFGVLLIVLGALVRFDAAGLVLLLSIPFFLLRIKNKKNIIVYAVCAVSIFAVKIVDNTIYKLDDDWAYYKEYNELRGRQFNDNPNAREIINDLPIAGVQKNDYDLLLSFFVDASFVDKDKLLELRNSLTKVSFVDKVKNIYPSLRKYTLFLLLIAGMFLFLIINSLNKNNYLFHISYLIFYLVILSYVSMDGSLKNRVFISSLFPVLYFLFNYCSKYNNTVKFSNIIFLILIILFSSNFQIRTNRILKHNVKWEHNEYKDQMILIDKYQRKQIIPFAGNLSLEFVNPFKVVDTYSNIISGGWLSNIPFNKDRFDSHISLVNNDLLLFISISNSKIIIPKIKKSLLDNYNYSAEEFVVDNTEKYMLVQFK